MFVCKFESRLAGWRARHPDAPATDRDDAPVSEIFGVTVEYPSHQSDPAGRWHVRQPDEARVIVTAGEDELTKILIHGYENAFFGRGPLKKDSVTGI